VTADANTRPFSNAIRNAAEDHRPLVRSEVYGSGPPVDAVSDEILDFVLSNVVGRCLDLGCGVGPYLGHLRAAGFEAVGLEYSPDIVAQAVKLGRPVIVGSATEIPFPDKSFDTVVMIEALEHVPNFRLALGEIARVATKRLVMTVPNFEAVPQLSQLQLIPWHMLEASHVNFFTNQILEAVLSDYFVNVSVRSLGHFFNVGEERVYMHCAAVADIS